LQPFNALLFSGKKIAAMEIEGMGAAGKMIVYRSIAFLSCYFIVAYSCMHKVQ
jgi:hypothetical protein